MMNRLLTVLPLSAIIYATCILLLSLGTITYGSLKYIYDTDYRVQQTKESADNFARGLPEDTPIEDIFSCGTNFFSGLETLCSREEYVRQSWFAVPFISLALVYASFIYPPAIAAHFAAFLVIAAITYYAHYRYKRSRKISQQNEQS